MLGRRDICRAGYVGVRGRQWNSHTEKKKETRTYGMGARVAVCYVLNKVLR